MPFCLDLLANDPPFVGATRRLPLVAVEEVVEKVARVAEARGALGLAGRCLGRWQRARRLGRGEELLQRLVAVDLGRIQRRKVDELEAVRGVGVDGHVVEDGEFDLVLGSDLTYDDAAHASLCATLTQLLRAAPESKMPRVVLVEEHSMPDSEKIYGIHIVLSCDVQWQVQCNDSKDAASTSGSKRTRKAAQSNRINFTTHFAYEMGVDLPTGAGRKPCAVVATAHTVSITLLFGTTSSVDLEDTVCDYNSHETRANLT